MQLAKDDPMVVAMNSSKIEVIVSQGYPRSIAKQVVKQTHNTQDTTDNRQQTTYMLQPNGYRNTQQRIHNRVYA